MTQRDTSRTNTPLYIRALGSLALIEILYEMVDSAFQAAGIQTGSLTMKLLQAAVSMAVGLSILWFWLFKDYRRLQIARLELGEREKDYYSLFDHNPDGVFLLDLEGRWLAANAALQEKVGYTVEELSDSSRFPFFSEEHRMAAWEHFFLARQGGHQRYETTALNKQGERLELDITYFPLYRNNQIAGVFGIAKDITDRKQAQQNLHDTETMLNSFFKNTSDSIIIFDTAGNILRVNHGCAVLYGWTEQELLGQSVDLFVPEHLEGEGQQMLQLAKANYIIAARETIRQTKDGSLLDVNVTVSPIRDENGLMIGIVGVSRDISTQRRVARELEEARSQFESVVKHTADAISIVDSNGLLLMVNRAWENLYGWTSDEVIGKFSPTVTNKSDLANFSAGKVLESFERTVVRKNGERVDVSITASPVYSPEGTAVGASFISKDISERKRSEEIVRRSEKLALAGELAAGIAHEIRNPLTSIQGFLQLMRTQFKPEYLDILLPEVRRIDEITDELLLLSRPQAEHQESTNMAWLLHDVVKLMESQANMYNVSIHQNISSGLPRIRCVKSQIKQVVINLIKNAIEAMPTGGNICLTLRPALNEDVGSAPVNGTSDAVGATSDNGLGQSHGVRLSVVDDGPGIPTEKLEQLGQPFYTTKERGTGLGLMVTYRIVQNHNGTIQVTSRPGKGTSFDIFLP